jgi:glycosyltransferase involved in cell wall biosynthesis
MPQPLFSIITPTYRRRENLERALASVLAQTYPHWEMIIINDSPDDASYKTFTVNDSRVRYYVNERNRGVNFSRNFGLDAVSADSTWVVFLDDDDYFAPDTLITLRNLSLANPTKKWLVTNRALKNGTPLTKFPSSDMSYAYMWSYLISKKLKGDATHCIETKLITHNKIRFSSKVKQAEEWFFFYQVGLHSKMFYHDHNSTISDGYDTQGGLNFRKRTIRETYLTIVKLLHEAVEKKKTTTLFFVYILLRLIKNILTNIRQSTLV